MRKKILSGLSYVLILCTLISTLAIAIPVSAFTVCDLNCDSKVNAVDVIILSTIIVGDYGNASVNKRADVNEDNKVNAVDASLMNKIVVGSYYNDKQIEGEFYSDSESADKYTNYLSNRIEETDRDVLVGVGDSETFGIDFSEYENDGYIIKNSGSYVLLFGKTTTGTDMAVRKYAKTIESGEKLDEITYHNGYRIKELKIFDKDISEYTILRSNPDNGNQVFAASELSRLVNIATGVKLNIADSVDEGTAIIELRNSDDESLKNDGFRYFEEDGKLVIEGAVQRGCMYGVWRFLENELGWDGLTYGDSILRSTDYLNVSTDVYKNEVPGTKYLCMYSDNTPSWAKFKNQKASPKAGQNGSVVITNCCHGMQSHRWTGDDVAYKQTCYSNTKNIETAKTNIRAWIEMMVGAGYVPGVDFLTVDIAQGDNDNFCMCRLCSRVLVEEGSHSGAVLRFANAMCEEFEKDYPELYFQIFAYLSTKKPPQKTVAHKMVSVTFCYDFNCSAHKLDGSECVDGLQGAGVPSQWIGQSNVDFDKWIRDWASICTSIFVWEYALDAAFLAYPVVQTIREDFEYLYDLGVVDGIFWQCQNLGYGFARIQYELCNQVYWNPKLTEEEYEEYYTIYMQNEYGDGWGYIAKYVHNWIKAVTHGDCWHCWGGGHWQWGERLNDQTLNDYFDENIKLFEKALKLCNSEEQERHIRTLSVHMYYEGVYGSLTYALKDGDMDKVKLLSDRYTYMVNTISELGYDIHHVTFYDGQVYDYHESMYDEAIEHWIGNYFDTHYRDLSKDDNGCIYYDKKLVWDGTLS